MYDIHKLIGLDFETYGSVDLPEFGLDNYTFDGNFQPLLAGLEWYASGVRCQQMLDFTYDFNGAVEKLRNLIGSKMVVAHNAGFEQSVLDAIGIYLPSHRFIDSAVVARAVGAAGKLEAAAPQLLDTDKLESGSILIKLFSIPGKYQEEAGNLAFDPRIVREYPDEWEEFKNYCQVDAALGLDIVLAYQREIPAREFVYNAITMDMNREGWAVDTVLLRQFQEQYAENQKRALAFFRQQYDPEEKLNLNSLPQLKKWCAERGVKARSFNEQSVAAMLKRLDKKIVQGGLTAEQERKYIAIENMLLTKQTLGGSSLKKLDVIARTKGHDDRLRDQYLHIGAGQSYRTTGRGAQLQNLKRLTDAPSVDGVRNGSIKWDNQRLAENLRQLFVAEHPEGKLIVGDFSSVESRGLARLAGELWKTDAFFEGKDLYKVLASKIYGKHYDQITKPERQVGKVGELSCGYGAGAGAVMEFAKNMGVVMTEAEAAKLVMDWRMANPRIVDFWDGLDSRLHDVLEGGYHSKDYFLVDSYRITVARVPTPESLLRQNPKAQSISVTLHDDTDKMVILTRFFHGCYIRGRNVCYYKPSERKTGDLWKKDFVHPKTKVPTLYTVYGGKLAGILTQSFCREIFFWILRDVHQWVAGHDNLKLIGQFHDEIVLEWRPGKPGAISLDEATRLLEELMSDATRFRGFPLDAEVKYDYRYTK